MSCKTTLCRLGMAVALLLGAAGCQDDGQRNVDSYVRDIASRPLDVTPLPAATGPATPQANWPVDSDPSLPAPPSEPRPPAAMAVPAGAPGDVRGAVLRDEAAGPGTPAAFVTAVAPGAPPAARTPPQPLQIPPALPGSEAPPIHLPPLRPGEVETQRRIEIEKLYAALPAMPAPVGPQLLPGQVPLTLDEAQRLAMNRSPLIRQAAADVEAARGTAIQAGLHPNPHVGYQADDINTGSTAGYQGVGISQTISTGGKLKLARSAAVMDLENARLTLSRTQYDLATQVRSNYFAVLVALERFRVNRALSEFAAAIYRAQTSQVVGSLAAPYEPYQVRVLAMQAQTQLIQSQHDYESAWRKLAATMNCPDMPPAPLAGRVDVGVPLIAYEDAKQRLLQVHPNLLMARNSVTKAQYQLKLAQLTPNVPDVDVNTVIEHDFTTPPFNTVLSLQVGVPLPIFDNNRGNILAADAALARACSEYDRARNELLGDLADIYARYQTNRESFAYYQQSILFDQVRAYRALYQRHQQDPDSIAFSDVVSAQQTLAGTIATYLQLLGDQWQAVIDLAGLLQADDLLQLGRPQPAAIPTVPPTP